MKVWKKQSNTSYKANWQGILFKIGLCFAIIANVWAILVDQVFSRLSTNIYLNQYALGFFVLVPFAGAVLTVSCFRCHSIQHLKVVSVIEIVSAIFLFVLYAKVFVLYETDVFGSDAHLLVSGYIWVLWIVVTWIVVGLGKIVKR